MKSSKLGADRPGSISPARPAFGVYGPMKFFVLYVMFTLVLHVFGPWEYQDEKLTLAAMYVFFALLLFSLGYRSFASRVAAPQRDALLCEINYWRFSSAAKFGVSLQALLALYAIAYGVGVGRYSFENIFNPGQTYIAALELARGDTEASFAGQVRTLAAPLIYFSNVFLLLNFRQIGGRWRLLLLVTLGLQVVDGLISKAAQKGIFDLLILMSSVGVIRAYFDRVIFLRWVRYSAIFLGFALVVFIYFQISRMTAYDALDYAGAGQAMLDRDGLIFSLFGNRLGLAISLFIGYLSQGYYGLSLSLQLSFEWTYGLGNSFALLSYAEQYFGVYGLEEITYPARMEAAFGWPAKMYWHTFFPWVASDLTFFGAAILMYFIGRAYARSFIEGVSSYSPLAVAAFYFLSTLLFFLPANNQLMQTREMMIGSCFLLVVWLVFGRRYARRRSVGG